MTEKDLVRLALKYQNAQIGRSQWNNSRLAVLIDGREVAHVDPDDRIADLRPGYPFIKKNRKRLVDLGAASVRRDWFSIPITDLTSELLAESLEAAKAKR